MYMYKCKWGTGVASSVPKRGVILHRPRPLHGSNNKTVFSVQRYIYVYLLEEIKETHRCLTNLWWLFSQTIWMCRQARTVSRPSCGPNGSCPPRRRRPCTVKNINRAQKNCKWRNSSRWYFVEKIRKNESDLVGTFHILIINFGQL